MGQGAVFLPLRQPAVIRAKIKFLRQALNLKTAVEPRIDTNGHGYQTEGRSERLTHEVKPVPRLYPCLFVCIRS
jgi:hypothetical protein